MTLRGWVIAAVGLIACDDGAINRPADARLTDAAVDAGLLDAGRLDADLAGLDMTPPDMLRPDMTPLDMRPVDVGVLDSAVDSGAPDAQLDASPLDMTPDAALDMAMDMRAPDLGPPPERACFDEIDNDEDGRVDCADPDCRPLAVCFDHPEDCANGVDDNGDNWADCDDVLCLDVCPPAGDPPLDVPAIQARFDQACLDCHAGPQPAALLDLTDFVATTVGVRSTQVDGLRIVPGDRQASYLWRKTADSFRTFEGGGGEGMPPVEALDASFVDRFGDWIDAL